MTVSPRAAPPPARAGRKETVLGRLPKDLILHILEQCHHDWFEGAGRDGEEGGGEADEAGGVASRTRHVPVAPAARTRSLRLCLCRGGPGRPRTAPPGRARRLALGGLGAGFGRWGGSSPSDSSASSGDGGAADGASPRSGLTRAGVVHLLRNLLQGGARAAEAPGGSAGDGS